MKHTMDSLAENGWAGYQYNDMTGYKLPARYPLDHIAYLMNNKPQRLRYTNDDIGRKVRVHIIKSDGFEPHPNITLYAERDMTEAEIIESDKRLSELGVIIRR